MEIKKLQKLQKHLMTLKLFKIKGDNPLMSLPKEDKTRFAMHNYEFDCGMPACVAGHAKHLFNWKMSGTSFFDKFTDFFELDTKETAWITESFSYIIINPTPATAAKHIQDVVDGKFGTA